MKQVNPQETKPLLPCTELAAKCDAPNQFEKFDALFRAVIAVPKAAIDKEEVKWRKAQATKKKTRKAL